MNNPPNCTECQDQHQADFRVTFSNNGDTAETTLCRDHAHMAATSAIYGDWCLAEAIKIERLEE